MKNKCEIITSLWMRINHKEYIFTKLVYLNVFSCEFCWCMEVYFMYLVFSVMIGFEIEETMEAGQI